MKQIRVFLLLPFVLPGGCLPLDESRDTPPVGELDVIAIYPVESGTPVEPSGLTMVKGRLYTVADKVDGQIFRVDFQEATVRLIPEIRFTPPHRGTMDWEGITSDPGGSFYLISEERGRLLRVTPDGRATWATQDLRKQGQSIGLFSKDNAGFEGIAWLSPNHWLGAVEREKRGLVEWTGVGSSLEVSSQLHEDSPYKGALPLLRLPDFSGLHADNSKVYALFRNAHLIVQLEKQAGVWKETSAWSYRHIETDPRWAYRSQTYGQAEGLVVDGNDVYLILDNNRGGRQADPSDRRPILIHARMPTKH